MDAKQQANAVLDRWMASTRTAVEAGTIAARLMEDDA